MVQIAKHIFFSGYVQGVGFRFTANSIANRYELTGFVRNAPDGRVEMLLQGDEKDIEDCIGDLQETFEVRDVQWQQVPVNSSYEDFRITF
ncbi:MAG: acylphosphatase [Phycisphaerae bacterium]|nr:acylphosphatase [Phycisphaerae bacterium]